MFWNAFWDGLLILLNYKVWLFVIGYSIISSFYFERYAYRSMMKFDFKNMIRSSISFVMRRVLLDSFMIVVVISFISPLLFGIDKLTPITIVLKSWLAILFITGVISIIRLIWGIIVSFESSYTKEGGLTSFAIGIFLITLMSKGIILNGSEGVKVDNYPSFWICAGWVLLSIAAFYLLSFTLGIALIPFRDEARNKVVDIFVIGGAFLMSITFMRTYGSYVTGNNIVSSISNNETPSQENGNKINWDKRLPNDISTACQLILLSEDVTNIDSNRMQIENFSNKIEDYPSDKKRLLKDGVVSFIKWNISATQDLNNYVDNLTRNSSAVFEYSDWSNDLYDSVLNYYKVDMIKEIKQVGDLAMIGVDYKSIKKPELKEISEKSKRRLLLFISEAHTAFKNIFNEDFN